jgi:hypothetical protein
MAVMALLGLQLALATVEHRREVDRQKPRIEMLYVPLLARVALGVYVAALTITVARSWREKQVLDREPGRMRRRWVVPVTAVAGLVAVGLLLLSIKSRPAREARPDNQTLTAVGAVPPAELAALGFLPRDTNLVAGCHIAEALHDPLARDLILGSSLKIGDLGFDSLERWTGLRFPELDHAVLGIKVDDRFPPRTILVVRTLRAIDESEVRRTLRAVAVRSRDGRDVCRIHLDRPRVEAFLWLANERTMIVTLSLKDLDLVPSLGDEQGKPLLPELSTYLRERVHAAPVWVVGHVPYWDKTPAAMFAETDMKEEWAVISKVRTFGAWLQAKDGIVFQAALDCMDADAAKALWSYLNAAERQGRSLPSFDQGPLVAALRRSFDASLEDSWVTLYARADAEAIKRE